MKQELKEFFSLVLKLQLRQFFDVTVMISKTELLSNERIFLSGVAVARRAMHSP